MEITIAETDHEKTLTERELKAECFLYARENFQGKLFRNTDIDRDILVSRDGLNKWSYITKSREQSISIKKLDVILENCKKVSDGIDKKNRRTVDGYTYFEYEMKINENPYKVLLATRETHGKHSKYYYHFLTDIKIEPGSGFSMSRA